MTPRRSIDLPEPTRIETGSRDSANLCETPLDGIADFRPRSGIARRLFPPTVPLRGNGEVVLVNAIGRPVEDVVERAHAFGARWIVATDDPNVGPLRAQHLVYEYVPSDAGDGLRGRIRWFDYVYGIDAVVDLDDLSEMNDAHQPRGARRGSHD